MEFLIIAAIVAAAVNLSPSKAGKTIRRAEGRAALGAAKAGARPVRALGRRARTSGIGWWGRGVVAAYDKAEAAHARGEHAKARRWNTVGDLLLGESTLHCHVRGCTWSTPTPDVRTVVEHLRTHVKPTPTADTPAVAVSDTAPPAAPAVTDPVPAAPRPAAPTRAPVDNVVPMRPRTTPAAPTGAVTPKGAPTAPPSTGGTAMAIDTVTGGEVTDLESLKAELDAILRESGAELDDATADAARADEEAGRIERMVSTLGGLQLPEQALAPIRGMADATQQRKAAAQARAAAAEARNTQAVAALEAIQPHLAIKEMAAAAGGAADARLYNGG